ncbi:hypothetical protein SCLCIDRAFT_1080289 [Scleroderma citrinum Foug A]|uniref:Uncharacterized protein n=1 Tax=Scleroderma citrinum Foug A TaxID=1036808 RepID=A0A0C3E571_9AGAM|nr:hypothetical protein SCLCIDRAFT_1080289 [Scleroderma citrinum Foug A]
MPTTCRMVGEHRRILTRPLLTQATSPPQSQACSAPLLETSLGVAGTYRRRGSQIQTSCCRDQRNTQWKLGCQDQGQAVWWRA